MSRRVEDGKTTKGVFVVKMKTAFVPVKRVYSVNTHIQEFQLSHEEERGVSEQNCERSERAEQT